MLEVEHVTKMYGSFTAVKDITFNVERGEIRSWVSWDPTGPARQPPCGS